MRTIASTNGKDSAREWASWTQASLSSASKSLRSAGSSIVTGIKAGYDHITSDSADKEKILWLKFGLIEMQQDSSDERCRVLVLLYEIGFQLWSIEGDTVKEMVSRREEPVRCLECVPLPVASERKKCKYIADWPLVAVVVNHKPPQIEDSTSDPNAMPSCSVKLYSLRSHSYIHAKDVPGQILKIACSPRVLLVAVNGQIMAYDICTMEITFSTVTYPTPSRPLSPGEASPCVSVPLALGPRWLAHSSNQAVQRANGIAVSHSLSNGSSPGLRGGNMEAVQHYASRAARTGGRQLKTLGEAGYKYFAYQVENWRTGSNSAPASPAASPADREDSDVAGTVIVRDVVTRGTVCHFRAHTSPLALLEFDGSGTMLATASVHGHTINVYHLTTAGREAGRAGTAVHLFKLARGVTPALIQTVAFSNDGYWLCATSARGTTHVFSLSSSDKNSTLPPHLEATSKSAELSGLAKPQSISAVGRARSAPFLNGAIPGTAMANTALSLCSKSNGTCLLAACFAERSERMENREAWNASCTSDRQSGASQDLWVASYNGQVIRHTISEANTSPQETDGTASLESQPTRPQEAEGSADGILVEPVESFDVCRRQSWPEREESMANSPKEESGASGQAAWASLAEVSIPGTKISPLWANPQFHILEMQTAASQAHPPSKRDEDSLQTAFQIEQLPTRRVNVSDRDGLAPVIIEGAETALLRGLLAKGNPNIVE